MSTLLLEIGCEEMPARFCELMRQQLRTTVIRQLKTANLLYPDISESAGMAWGTPRRIAVSITGILEKQPDTQCNYRGPACDASPQAVAGFARKHGVSPDALVSDIDGDKPYWFYRARIPGKYAQDWLPEGLAMAIGQLQLPLEMRWKSGQPFIRPVHWLCALLDTQVIPLHYWGLTADRVTYGHRFLSGTTYDGEPVVLSHAQAYRDALARVCVLVDPKDQQDRLVAGLGDAYLATRDMAEYPTVLTGHIPKTSLPLFVIRTCIETHQKAIVCDETQFKFVADSVTEANKNTIIAGNERVIQARLADARFFFETDRKKSLLAYRDTLKQQVFQDNVGTLYDKSERLTRLALQLDANLDPDLLAHCKCDLATTMVRELPDLQGHIGALYYALDTGKDGQVIAEHYYPKVSGDRLPSTPAGICIAIADRLDTIVCAAYNAYYPTGSKDKYGLRRHLNSLCRLFLASTYRLDDALAQAYQILCQSGIAMTQAQFEQLNNFCQARVYEYMTSQHGPLVSSCRWHGCIRHLDTQITALQAYRDAAPDMTQALRQATIRIHKLCAKQTITCQVSPALFTTKQEQALYDACVSIAAYDVSQLQALNALLPVIDAFFESVLVMVDDNRRDNRIALLQYVYAVLTHWVDWGTL